MMTSQHDNTLGIKRRDDNRGSSIDGLFGYDPSLTVC